MSRTAPHEQPKVSPTLRLLKAAYLHEGLALDLYGAQDEDGYEVNDVALGGTNISLREIVTVEFLESLANWCFWNLPSGAELRREGFAEARIEQRVFAREFAMP